MFETLKIKSLGEATLFDGKFIRVIGKRFVNKQTGKTGLWECVKRKTYGNIVAILAVTPDLEIILTKTFRIPLEAYVIELCAGLMDSEGMTEVELAAKELREETGYQAREILPLMSGPFNAGLVQDFMSVFLGLDAIKVGEPELENAEDIEVIKIPLIEAYDYLSHPPEGVLVDIKTIGFVNHPEVTALFAKLCK